jgi:DNA-binding LytR/AlgR family response regulator
MMFKTIFKVIIVGNEYEKKPSLKKLLSEVNCAELVGEAGNENELINIVKKIEFDVLLVDIDMIGMDGFNLIQKILNLGYYPYIVLLSNFKRYALTAFDLGAIDYIIKPVHLARLIKTFNKITKLTKRSFQYGREFNTKLDTMDKIFIKSGAVIILIDIESIIMIERNGTKSTIYCKDNRYQTRETLRALEQKLHHPQFIRSHQAYIVNIKYIHKINPIGNRAYEIIFQKQSPNAFVSRKKSKKLFSLLNILR